MLIKKYKRGLLSLKGSIFFYFLKKKKIKFKNSSQINFQSTDIGIKMKLSIKKKRNLIESKNFFFSSSKIKKQKKQIYKRIKVKGRAIEWEKKRNHS